MDNMDKELLNSDKELLLKDLCARLPYGVKCQIKGEEDSFKLKSFMQGDSFYAFDFYIKENLYLDFKTIEEFKPYLFPISNMTEEQKEELNKCVKQDYQKEYDNFVNNISNGVMKSIPMPNENVIEFYHKNYIDYRGLISKGLAIDATELNIY